MDSEDDISNASGHRNNSRHVHYDDIDEYLDEAMDSDEEDADDIAAAKNQNRDGKELVS